MADIDIQRKETAIWPWIVGLVVLALLIWAALSLLGRDDTADPIARTDTIATTTPGAAPAAAAATSPAAVQTYMDTCAPREPQTMDLGHAHTSNCIRRLADGIESLVQERNLTGVQVQPQLQQARQSADRLDASGEQQGQHSSMARDGFQSIAQAMSTVRNTHYPQLDAQVTQVENAAAAVQPGQNLLDQRDAVQRFFDRAGEALNTLATATPGAR